MSRKQNRGKGKNKSKRPSGEDNTYGLQAVILADSYTHRRFGPITQSMPKMLIPVAGCPMINYSIDLLINSHVSEIFIICSSHAAQLKEHMEGSKWMNPHWYPNLKIHIICIEKCETVGDALRYIEESIVSKTFVLCRGDCIANISLTSMIKKHEQRYKESTDCLMTCLFKKAHPSQRATSLEHDLFLVINDDAELLQYENDSMNCSMSLDLSLFDEHSEIEMVHNVMDCGIDICSRTVLTLFTDNFDYNSIRKELFEGVIRSEIYPYKVYVSLLSQSNEYAARILDWKTYAGVTADIVERWTYPLVLDSNVVSHTYSFKRNNIYDEDGVGIGLNSLIRKNCVLGFKTKIGDHCVITDSVIGPHCVIGDQCRISNCFLFGKCRIGNEVTMNGVVMANQVVVGNSCYLPRGCILSFGVVLDDNVRLEQFTKITLHRMKRDLRPRGNDDDFGFDSDDMLPQQTTSLRTSPKERVLSHHEDDDGGDREQTSSIMDIMDGSGSSPGGSNGSNDSDNIDDDDDEKYDVDIVGVKGKGFLYEIEGGGDSFVLDSMNNVLSSHKDRPPRGHSVADLDPRRQKEEEENGKENTAGNNTPTKPFHDPIGNGKKDTPPVIYLGNVNDKLVSEIADCIDSAETNASINMDDVVVEISTSVRLANHCNLEDFSCAVFMALLRRIPDTVTLKAKQEGIGRLTEKYCCLFERLAKREEDQEAVMSGLLRACRRRGDMGPICFCLEALDKLYYEDIVSLEAIQQWNAKREKSAVSDNDKKFEQYLTMSIEALKEAEEGSSEDDDDDDDDDDDEES